MEICPDNNTDNLPSQNGIEVAERGEDDQSPHKNGKPPEAKFKGIPDDLEKLTIRELKDIAGAYNKLPHTKDKIKNFGKLRKHELIEALSKLRLS